MHEESSCFDIFVALHQRGSHRNLESADIARVFDYEEMEQRHDWATYLDSSHSFVIDDETLHLLSSFRKLQHLAVASYSTERVNDGAFVTFLSSCTELKTLHIRDDTMDENPPALTFQGVQSALQKAPLLEELSLRFDASDVAENHIL